MNSPLDEDMVQGIDDVGVLQPILVQKNPETGKTEVIVGRQRVKNCAEANRRRAARGEEPRLVPAVARTYARHKPDAAADLMVIENEHRQADTPMVRAAKMARLRDMGRSDEQLARIFHCTPQTVRATLALTTVTSAVAAAVDAGKITAGQARKLADLAPDDQRAKVAELVQAGEGAEGHARARAQREVMGDAKPKMRTRREIQARRDQSASKVERAVLDWVLGGGAC